MKGYLVDFNVNGRRRGIRKDASPQPYPIQLLLLTLVTADLLLS
ncbi:hypothetical protein HMPREF1015_02111 [Bacillus smithii 7_3_47FAA]|uniref:Uncharacterized protein n=1 Tax=Bacillus smithii 7_3_47FAA TaxID=665952 RepID=G9QIV0_9BACI|nr:hypothetical protein HMPREF1015_02111 [Bacillus smithii 7_3_47FAA]